MLESHIMTPPNLPEQTYRSAAVIGKKPLHFTFAPDQAARVAIAAHLGLLELPQLQLKGSFAPQGRGDVALRAQLVAQVVQPCAITLDPVAAQINAPIQRDYLRDYADPTGQEVELGPDDSEAMPEYFDVAAIAIEELALSLPPYPRSPGASLGQMLATPKGAAPLTQDVLRPFAGLARALQGGQDSPPADDKQ
jgi:uncharacterized metal-binding protein YceD (DUF177 family)